MRPKAEGAEEFDWDGFIEAYSRYRENPCEKEILLIYKKLSPIVRYRFLELTKSRSGRNASKEDKIAESTLSIIDYLKRYKGESDILKYRVLKAIRNDALDWIKKIKKENSILRPILNDAVTGNQSSHEIVYEKKEIVELVLKKAVKTLSKKEYAILCYISEGNSYQEIADLLDMSENTVRKHYSNLLRKLTPISREIK